MAVITARELLKTTGIILASPDDLLGSVLSRLGRSHDVAFVVQGELLLGVVNPHYVLFKKNFPPETKVKHCLFHPPKLSLDSSLWDIITIMRESRLYFL